MRVLILNIKKLAIPFLFLLFFTYITWHLSKSLVTALPFKNARAIITWNDFLNFKTVFLSIIIEALPFILIGVLVSAILENFLSEETIRKVLPGNRILNIFLACFLGIIFPVCECGIVPVARRLVSKGVPLYSAITFMLAAPIINPVVASSTAVAFSANPKIVWFRLGLAFFVSFVTGLLLSYWFDSSELKRGIVQNFYYCGCDHEHHDHHHNSQPTFKTKIINTFQSACDEFFDMGKYLIMGASLAAIAQTFVSRDIILNIGQNSLSSIAAMMTFAFGVSVCSSADAFIAASFATNFTTGSLLAFMVFGPMIDMKNNLMLLNAFKARFVIALVMIVSLLVIGSTLLINIVSVGGFR
ncbi:MAG: putative permease [Pelotomaculum sp. PtaB.Bin013]|uniref:Permease n=1 Tax=Pelotomaculum isophthalicicum JI TaxID=947010 RepID=A0A9X4H2I4_9FIRM|nr:permease [Pelotomaculum isophthalicicum]MDF9408865.1 permease [Pelotomaculum isophthalicicum JI]OPX82914.1 MAG: putative permease [Pelotomaculum sp. PtaB.Bin013]